ncbi:6,7-dimethyl-8-ribityllumazine synthase [Muribaculaceae bacterium]|jgi:6,7-dimethyl-8-ribityllumazine synthase|nr:6,7-dimethyl-8-ribityllumazine synthase [Muribaculaceae bacterium]GFI06900.1 6,7-dimethyl-8-ribityllumazine synthase [Muribaculaceae bacterium]
MKQYAPAPVEFDAPVRVAVVRAQWNSHITSVLADGAVNTLEAAGAEAEVFEVPGAVELTFAAQSLIDTERYDAVIVFGCVIKGDTPHFDYVCQSVTQGVTALNVDSPVPVIFGVLTVLDEQQALDRCGGPAGHKGVEAATTALTMVAFSRSL